MLKSFVQFSRSNDFSLCRKFFHCKPHHSTSSILSSNSRRHMASSSSFKPIELYSFGTPNGQKIHIFLEESGLPFNAHTINILANEQFFPEYLKISPNNKIPAIVDPECPSDGKPISVYESGAILIYLADKIGKFIPPISDVRRRAEVLEWLFWQVGGVGPMLGQLNHFAIYSKEKIPYAIERYTNEANRLLTLLDFRLQTREWVAAGEYTIADMSLYAWINLRVKQSNENEYPNVRRWLARIAARPATARAMELCTTKSLPDPKAWGTFKQPENWKDVNVVRDQAKLLAEGHK